MPGLRHVESRTPTAPWRVMPRSRSGEATKRRNCQASSFVAGAAAHGERPEDGERNGCCVVCGGDGRDGDLSGKGRAFAPGARGESKPVGHHGDFAGEEKVAGLGGVKLRRAGMAERWIANDAAIEFES